MFGPRLDARSYTTMLLVVIASLLTLNLMAQYGASSSSSDARNREDYSDAGSNRDIATATREVAASTKAVADSNRAIADAIRELADAVREAGAADDDSHGTMDIAPVASDAPPAAATGEQAPAVPAEPKAGYEGKFELN